MLPTKPRDIGVPPDSRLGALVMPLNEQLRGATLLSVPQAAELFSCSRSTIYGLIKTHAVRIVMLNTLLRIPLAELTAYVERQAVHYFDPGRIVPPPA